MSDNVYANLSAEVAELPSIARPRKHIGPNPFAEMLSASFAEGTGRAVTLPAENIGEAQNLIRKAAEKQGIGARIVVEAKGVDKVTPAIIKEWAEKKSKAKVRLLFQAQERRRHAKPAETSPEVPVTETPAETPSEAPAAQ